MSKAIEISRDLPPCECGSKDVSIGYESPQGYWVECGDCGYQTEKSHSRELIIAKWDKRTAPADEFQEPVAYDLSKAEYFEGVAELRQQSLTRAWGKIRKLRDENDQIKAKLMHQEAEAGTLAERMKAAGMMTVDELLAGAPLDAFTRHAGVNSLEAFAQWLEMRRREYVTMQAKRTLDKREDDDLYEWVLAHAGVFGEVHVNFKAAMAAHEKNG